MEDIVFYYPEGHSAHYEDGHPERPDRVETIRTSLEKAGWWSEFPHLPPVDISGELLQSIHTAEYLKELENASMRGSRLDMDTYTTTESWQLALNAAGGALAIARSVWLGESRRGLALTRPPGHHATINRGMGFCLLNNVAIAAQDLLVHPFDGKSNAEKLAIIDLDLHHGNGTQDIFWRRSDVFYFSTHQFPHYPGTGDVGEIGVGDGEGYTANFPMPPMTGDQGFSQVMESLIIPLLDQFSPDMILVSFGFDTHWLDPLGQLILSAQGYGQLIARLADWADRNCEGKIALFLEGGYDLEAGAACSQGVTAALLGQPWNDPLGASPRQESQSWLGMFNRSKSIWEI